MNRDTIRSGLRPALALFYFAAGVLHQTQVDKFVMITPDWVPDKPAAIVLTGLCEIAGAIGLLIPATRRAAAIGLALYAACVYPANIKHAFEHIAVPGLPDTWWYHAPRLLLQPLLIWLPLFAAGLIAWPFGRRSGSRR